MHWGRDYNTEKNGKGQIFMMSLLCFFRIQQIQADTCALLIGDAVLKQHNILNILDILRLDRIIVWSL